MARMAIGPFWLESDDNCWTLYEPRKGVDKRGKPRREPLRYFSTIEHAVAGAVELAVRRSQAEGADAIAAAYERSFEEAHEALAAIREAKRAAEASEVVV